MFEFLNFLDWGVFLQVATAVVTAASAIAAVTPTQVDNRVVAWLRKAVNVLALNVGKAKGPK